MKGAGQSRDPAGDGDPRMQGGAPEPVESGSRQAAEQDRRRDQADHQIDHAVTLSARQRASVQGLQQVADVIRGTLSANLSTRATLWCRSAQSIPQVTFDRCAPSEELVQLRAAQGHATPQ